MRAWGVAIAAVFAGCGRVGFDRDASPQACAPGAACTPAAACWTGACSPAGLCLPDEPIATGACPQGTCVAGVCEGGAPGVLPIPLTGMERMGSDLDWVGDRLVVGEVIAGTARILDRVDGGWGVTATITSTIGGPGTEFGIAVAVDGDRAIIGANSADTGVGAAAVFDRDVDGTWVETAVLRHPGTLDFGSAVALEGDRALVGAETTSAAYLFERQLSGQWTEVAVFGPIAVGDDFGKNVVLAGTTAFISSTWESPPGPTDETGAIRVFERDTDGGWPLTAVLFPPVSEDADATGIGLAVDGDLLAVGAPMASRDFNGAGVVVLYRKIGGAWTLEAVLHEPEQEDGSVLGQGVAVQGDRVTATMVRGTDGLLVVFRRVDGTWLEVGRKVDPAGDEIGYGVGGIGSDAQIEWQGDTVMVGMPLRSSPAGGGVVIHDIAGL